MSKRTEQAPEIQPRIRDRERAEIFTEINVFEVWEYGDDLVLMAEGGYEGDDGVTAAEVVEEL